MTYYDKLKRGDNLWLSKKRFSNILNCFKTDKSAATVETTRVVGTGSKRHRIQKITPVPSITTNLVH